MTIQNSNKMNSFATILLHLVLISSTDLIQSQFPLWSGTYSIINTAANTMCNQSVCCCFTGPITITTAAVTIGFSSNIQGIQCNSDTTVTTTFPLPSAFVIIPSDIGFTTTDIYILTLSSDSNTLSINDTTNQQCSAMAQRDIVGNGTSTSYSMTTIPQNAVNTTYTIGMAMMSSTTSQQPNGSEALYYDISCYLFLSLLALVMT